MAVAAATLVDYIDCAGQSGLLQNRDSSRPDATIIQAVLMLANNPHWSVGMLRWIMTVIVAAVSYPSVASAQLYVEADFSVPTRTLSVTENVFQRNIEVIMGVPQVGTETRLALPEFDVVAGGRVTIGFQGPEFGVEGSYFGTDTLTSNAIVFDDAPGMLASPFTAIGSPPDPLVDNNVFADVLYQTEMQSAEINVTHRLVPTLCGESVFIAGIRALTIDEQFRYTSDNIALVNNLNVREDNFLIGPQIGVAGRAYFPMGSIEFGLKGGIAYNDIDATSRLNAFVVDTSRETASLIGELEIGYIYQPTPFVAIRFGYQLLGITNVGIAATSNAVGTAAAPTNEGVLYQVPYAGVILTL